MTFFEATTGLAFKYFEQQKPDILILECGLGGRLDSTNVVHSPVSIITKIALDHQQFLGDTIEKISTEKAGIIFPESNVFTSNRAKNCTEIIEKKCFEVKAQYNNIHDLAAIELKIMSAGCMTFNYFSQKANFTNLSMPLIGKHQLENVKLAITTLLYNSFFKIEQRHIKNGLASILWPGRLQLLHKKPNLLLDAGHNPDGFKNSLQTAKKVTPGKLYVVCGIVDDKNIKEIAETVEDYSDFVKLVDFQSRRALPGNKFIKYFLNKNKVKIAKSRSYEEIENLLSNIKINDTILLIGSHYLAGKFLQDWIKYKKQFASYYKTD